MWRWLGNTFVKMNYILKTISSKHPIHHSIHLLTVGATGNDSMSFYKPTFQEDGRRGMIPMIHNPRFVLKIIPTVMPNNITIPFGRHTNCDHPHDRFNKTFVWKYSKSDRPACQNVSRRLKRYWILFLSAIYPGVVIRCGVTLNDILLHFLNVI